jgi:hypothetical protein
MITCAVTDKPTAKVAHWCQSELQRVLRNGQWAIRAATAAPEPSLLPPEMLGKLNWWNAWSGDRDVRFATSVNQTLADDEFGAIVLCYPPYEYSIPNRSRRRL